MASSSTLSPRVGAGSISNPLASQTAMFNEEEFERENRRMASEVVIGGQRRVPWKAVGLAALLAAFGAAAILAGLIVMGTGSADGEHGLALLVVGSLMFIPGAYHSVIAYKAFMGRPGFSFAALPDV